MNLVVRKKSRIDILDAIRGIAILSMVVYHALYDVYDLFGYKIQIFDMLGVLEPPFAGAFILLSGISSRFSHDNVRRGARVFILAMAVTFVTILFSVFVSPGEEIYFGILHFLGAAILLYAVSRRLLDRIPPKLALILWLMLFAVTYNMPFTYQLGFPGLASVSLPASLSNNTWLFPLGLPGFNFFSADYFPLVPWMFLFLAGTVIGVPIRENRLPQWFYSARIPFFAAAGRNTLLIYVIHQPVIYLILLAAFHIMKLWGY